MTNELNATLNEPLLSPEDMEKLKTIVRDFVRKEYDDEVLDGNFDNLTCVGIAETNVEDREDIVIDMAINVKDLTLDQYINEEKQDSWHYDSLDSLLNEIRNISFDELVSLGPQSEKRVAQLKEQFPSEHDFLRNPEDAYALYQLKYSHENHMLLFSDMDDLKWEAKHFRQEIHKVANTLEDRSFENKEQAEGVLKDFGMTVIPNADAYRITIQNEYGMKGDILLAYGQDNCRFDGCDTRGLDEPVRHEHYRMLYSGPIDGSEKPEKILNDLYEKFNQERPPYFLGRSMSVSDVVVLMQNGQATAYYCDSIGFTKLPGFLADQPLRNAEMLVEDDYNMIDGIINNGPKQEEKPSLREQLSDIKAELKSRKSLHTEKKHTNDKER